MVLKLVKIRSYEVGLQWVDQEFRGLLDPGWHWIFDPLRRVAVEVVTQRTPWLVHDKLDLLVKSGALRDRATVLDLLDHQRALVWLDGRFSHVLPPGLHVYWTLFREVKVEVVDARQVRFEHKDLAVIAKSPLADRALDVYQIEAHQAGVLIVDGDYVETLRPGRYAFWKQAASVKVVPLDLRVLSFDVGGQEIMTADKVTLRVNASVSYRVSDPRLAVSVVDDLRQALYREAQLALRAVVGVRELDAFLADKDAVVSELEQQLRGRLESCGAQVVSVGIRDVILPGEMRELMNKVTEAKKAAEANLIARREETAAMRSQVNTAKLLQDNPTLMRLRELEVLEKVAADGKLNIFVGEKGLAERVVNLL